jgi:type IX secretion system PorP/SprF family membrane protein
MRKQKYFLLLMLLPCFLTAQDFTFSQFYEMPLLRNPALAGVFKGDLRVATAHRNQWSSVTVPFKTTAMDLEWKLPVFNHNDFITLGLQASYDVAGDVKLKRTQILPVLSFHKSLSDNKDNYLSLAFMAGSVQSQFDPTQAKMDDQFITGAYSPTNVSSQSFAATGYKYMDASVGLNYSATFGYESRYYLGAALFHFNQPKVNFFASNSNVHLKNKIVFNAGIVTPINERNELVVYADYFKQGGNGQFFGGVLYEMLLQEYEEENDRIFVAAGGFYRWGDAVVPVIKLNMHVWSLGLSYDINVSKLASASKMQGGLEMTLTYKGFFRTDNSSQNKLRCVQFK